MRSAYARDTLDRRLDAWRRLPAERPHAGWIKAIRDALGMSKTELAARLGVVPSRITAIENAEAKGTLKIETLERAAHALDCELVYALVPRRALQEAVTEQARRKAEAKVRGVGHHMALEDQEVSGADREEAIERLAYSFVDRRGLWHDEEP